LVGCVLTFLLSFRGVIAVVVAVTVVVVVVVVWWSLWWVVGRWSFLGRRHSPLSSSSSSSSSLSSSNIHSSNCKPLWKSWLLRVCVPWVLMQLRLTTTATPRRTVVG
jgi:hypothetical protein